MRIFTPAGLAGQKTVLTERLPGAGRGGLTISIDSATHLQQHALQGLRISWGL